ARHALALGSDEALDREALDALDLRLWEARRHDQVHAALVVLGRVVVPVWRIEPVRDDLARKRRDRAAVRAEDAALDLDARDELFHEHLLVVAKRELDRRPELFLRAHLRDSDRRAEPGGFDEDRIAERVPELVALA